MSAASRPVEWEAATYDRLAAPQEAWGREVIARLDLAGEETVLDAGCGSGRVSALLLERLPRGRLIGVDGSQAMIDQARVNIGADERVELLVGDLLELELPEPVDAVFSNATFHWVLDHRRLFERLLAALRPGGVLEAQCGGEGNVAEWQRVIEAAEGDERFAAHLGGMPATWNFASAADTRDRLEEAGFEVGRVWLEERVVEPSEPREYARSSGLAKHLAALPSELHDQFVDAVLGTLPQPLKLRYVRLNISARRPR